MDERFKNYLNEELKCLFNGVMCNAVFTENSLKFITVDRRELANIKYSDIKDMFRGTFPNSASVYFKEGDKNHSVQTFKTTKFIEYTKWAIASNKK